MAARVESDIEDSELENGNNNSDSDSGSAISVSTVNTEDLSDLSFSEDEGAEIGWSRDDSPVNVTAFISAIGATTTVPEDGTAKDFFSLFVPEELFENIVEETNRYARQCIARKPDAKWYETSVAEMQAFFGLHILFGIHVLPETSLYWSKDPALSVPLVKRVMTRDGFDKLNQYLHLNDNDNFVPRGQPNHDKLFKVRPFLEAVVKNLHEGIAPNRICLWMRQWLHVEAKKDVPLLIDKFTKAGLFNQLQKVPGHKAIIGKEEVSQFFNQLLTASREKGQINVERLIQLYDSSTWVYTKGNNNKARQVLDNPGVSLSGYSQPDRFFPLYLKFKDRRDSAVDRVLLYQTMLHRPGQLEKLKYRSHRGTSDEGSIKDVYDSKLYKMFSGPGGFLASASNISLLGNTDGVALICSTSYGVWPVFLVINELSALHKE
ncbi:hypothetical protein ACROYT_G014399 [Oculina patagonica]